MKEELKDLALLSYESILDELFTIETIIKLMHNYCLHKEQVSANCSAILSEERNRYITLLNITLEKIEKLKNINFDFENKVLTL